MAYTYKYIPAGTAIQVTPQADYLKLMQEVLTDQFDNASDVFTIQEETAFASGSYQNVSVRINYAINSTTGERVGDDFKKILFKDLSHYTSLGLTYTFDDNYWLTIEVDKIKTMAPTVVVRRCNNMLKWQDATGAIYQVPTVINYIIKENRDYSTAGSALVVPSGIIEVVCQYNSKTNKIRPNQRFLFGNPDNWIAYRVEGGGIVNFNLLKTADNTSAGLIKFSMAVDYVNPEVDDLVNGIANAVSESYTLTLNESSISGSAGQTVQLQANVTLNDALVTRTVDWATSASTIATVSTSGLVTFVATGSATITCSLRNNASVNDTCAVSVGASSVDIYQIRMTPNVNYVLEDSETTFVVGLYKNNVLQPDTFTFVLDSNSVPGAKYTYTVVGGNSFKIRNNGMYLTDTLDVTATSGANTALYSFALKGAW